MILRPIHTLFLLLPLFLFSSCSSSKKVEPEELPKEIKTRAEYAEDAPSYTLFQNAKRNFANQLYSVAKDSFQSLRDSYPTGAYAEFAEVKIADCTFASGEYAQAAQLYEEFTKSRPISSSVPYALYKAAHSSLLSHRGIGRDSSNLQKAVELSDLLLSKFPESPYSEGTKKIKESAQEKMAQYQRMVIAFYKKKSATSAYSAREEKFEHQFGIESSKFEPKLNELAVEDRLKADSVSDVRSMPAPQLVAANLSDSMGRARSLESPSQINQPSSKNSFKNTLSRERNTGRTEDRTVARSASCDANSGMIFLNLNRPLSEQIPSAIPNGDGKLYRFNKVRPSSDQGLSISCGPSGSITLSRDGELRVSPTTSANSHNLAPISLFTLENPPRLVIAALEKSSGISQPGLNDN